MGFRKYTIKESCLRPMIYELCEHRIISEIPGVIFLFSFVKCEERSIASRGIGFNNKYKLKHLINLNGSKYSFNCDY